MLWRWRGILGKRQTGRRVQVSFADPLRNHVSEIDALAMRPGKFVDCSTYHVDSGVGALQAGSEMKKHNDRVNSYDCRSKAPAAKNKKGDRLGYSDNRGNPAVRVVCVPARPFFKITYPVFRGRGRRRPTEIPRSAYASNRWCRNLLWLDSGIWLA